MNGTEHSDSIHETLVAYGAPLVSWKPVRHMSLEQALVHGLGLSHGHPALFRVLPLVLLRNAEALDWERLRALARDASVAAELGLMVELTAKAVGRPELMHGVSALRLPPDGALRFFHEPRSEFGRELVRQRTPPVAKRWGFWLDMSEDSVRALVQKHGAWRRGTQYCLSQQLRDS
ncbi:hypothetical protein [Archangium sp.]|uniref:hypothetical protein n=1 Tax=Archangium sp. TaxID=1872627 RepID=UPI002D5643A9|nr:hypothetical protein [Archangium sp.]HYO55945.1 hypothetical protein [Archangium sp.]